jgi:hypothetical protein
MPKVAALVDAHSLCAFVVIPKACSSLGLVHPATTTFSFLFLVFFSCSVPVLFSLLLRLLLLRGCHRVACHFDAAVFLKNKCCAQGRYPCGGGHGVQSLHSTRRLSTHLSWVLYTELVARCIFILGFLTSWEQTEKVKPNILNTCVSWVPPMPILLFVVLYIFSSSCAELRMYMTRPRCLEGTDF